MNIEKAFKKILDCSFKIHTTLGPGLLESVYVECLCYELIKSGISVEKQKPLRFSKCKLGLLVNFNVVHLKDGIRRVVL